MIGIIIQARMGSTRLPGKVLMPIGKEPLLGYIFQRLSFLKEKDIKIVVATSEQVENDKIEQFCKERNVSCFRGSETNVLERYYLCAKKYQFHDIIRLTADNPFVDVEELDNLLICHKNNNADYTKSFEALPYGVGAEVFSMKALERDYNEASMQHHFEHVNEYILENPKKFKIVDLQTIEEKRMPDVRLTVDTEEDYRRACYIVEHSDSNYISTQEAIRLCSQFA